jgi:hypothetical protein
MQGKRLPWQLVLALITLILAQLACGGFQVRVTPTPEVTDIVEAGATAAATEPPRAGTTPRGVATDGMPAATPTPSVTPTVEPAIAGMAPNARARVTASGGVNVRAEPRASAKQVGRLNQNANVTLLEGPVQADKYDWWRVDNGAGLAGWVAIGPQNDPWLVPAVAAATAAPPETPGAPKVVDRAIKVGDRVQVTTDTGQVLTVRNDAAKAAAPVARVLRGTLFTVKGGPIKQDNLVWWQLESDTVKGWAAEGDGTNKWLQPVE